MATPAKLLQDSLLVIWNDRDANRRLEGMKKIYAPDIHFFESSQGEAIVGHQAINELISKLQTEWVIEFRFEWHKPLTSKPFDTNYFMESRTARGNTNCDRNGCSNFRKRLD